MPVVGCAVGGYGQAVLVSQRWVCPPPPAPQSWARTPRTHTHIHFPASLTPDPEQMSPTFLAAVRVRR